MNTIADFVAFLRRRWIDDNRDIYRPEGDDGPVVEYHPELLYEGTPDTEGGQTTFVNYTELLREIDALAAEFAKERK